MPKVIPQTFLFPKEDWTRASAIAWLRANGYRYDKVDPKGGHYRFRQFDPEGCKPNTYGTKTWTSRRDAGGKGRRKPKRLLAVFCSRSFE